jgi:ferredoxin/flavodoxin---NADP+ reductase
MRVLEVAVVGSGPAGLYTAEALVKHAAALPDPTGTGLAGPAGPVRVRVDVFDRLPTPYGLVRYGVAPDHKSIKSIAEYLRKVLESPDVRFIGGVHLGEDLTRAELLAAYDAVVYATGAMRDRRLGIPGEDLPGSYAATDFVNWYCGHPDVGPSSFTLDAESVAVIGVGNVAVDVARILARDPAELRTTDISQPVLEALQASKVREVHVIGRRGPAHAKFTTKELRELGELPGVGVMVPAIEADLDAFDGAREGTATAESDRRVRGNMVVIRKWATNNAQAPAAPASDAPTALASAAPSDAPVTVATSASADAQPEAPEEGHARTLTIRFWLRPVEIIGDEQVTGLVLERTRLDENGAFQGTGELETLDAQMVLRSVGYQSVPLDGVPFDERAAVVPNAAGRVLGPDGTPLPGEYVAGWLKRGPTGVIGTNKSDAAETVRNLLADLVGGAAVDDAALPRPGVLRYPDGAPTAAGARVLALEETLARRGIRPVSYAEWLRVETAEADLARSLGRGDRVKLHGKEALFAACWPADDIASDPPSDQLSDPAGEVTPADPDEATPADPD